MLKSFNALSLILAASILATGCGQKRTASPAVKINTPATPATPPSPAKNDVATDSRQVDSGASRDVEVHAVPVDKLWVEVTGDFTNAMTGSELTFQNKKILAQNEEPGDLSCTVKIRQGMKLVKSAQYKLKVESDNSVGSGGSLSDDGSRSGFFQGWETTVLSSLDAPIESVVCRRQLDANNNISSTKVSDLDETFGEWLRIIVTK